MEIAAPVLTIAPVTPPQESTAGAPGAAGMASDSSHTHPSISSRHRVALNSSSVATVTYARKFSTKPVIVLTAINPSGRPVQLEVTSDIMTGADYTGCTIKGYRSQLLPGLSGILLIGPLISALSAFDVLGGSAANVEVSVVAFMPSN